MRLKKLDFRIYRRLLVYVRPYRGRLLVAMIASVGVGLTNAGYASLIRPLVDKVILGGYETGIYLVPAVVVGMALFKGRALPEREGEKNTGVILMANAEDRRPGLFPAAQDLVTSSSAALPAAPRSAGCSAVPGSSRRRPR